MVSCLSRDASAIAIARATHAAMAPDDQALMAVCFKDIGEPMSELGPQQRQAMGYAMPVQTRPGSVPMAGGRVLTPTEARARLAELSK